MTRFAAEICEIKFLKCFGKNVIRTLNENIAIFSFNVLITFLPKHFKNFISQISAANRVKKKLYSQSLVTYI